MSVDIIDTHQHFWNLDLLEYSWLVPAYGPLYRSYGPQELEPQLAAAGVASTVLVQAANSYDETNYLLRLADAFDWIAGVVGWVPLTNPREAGPMLDRLRQHPKFVGMRHLIHEEQDPRWLQQPLVFESLGLLAERELCFDAVPVTPEQLENVPVIAEAVPELRIVIDHLAKPPIKEGGWQPWADGIARCAEHPNVYAKLSGLNTAADWEGWSAADLQRYIDFAVEQFGAERLMFGSDWPVAVLAGDYRKVRDETATALAPLSAAEREAIWSRTASSFYRLGL